VTDDTTDEKSGPSLETWRELVAVLLLSVTAIITAWTGFQASKWGGAMSISFSEASSSRIAASRAEAKVNTKINMQVGLFTQWLQAYQNNDQQLADFLEQRFPEPLATAFPAWLDSKPLKNPDAAPTPFQMPEYVVPEQADAEAADKRADEKFADALANNQRGDNYTVLTIGFAVVLFFGAIAGRLKTARAQWALLTLGWVGFVVLFVIVLTYPKLV
jgi:hypothetical protein